MRPQAEPTDDAEETLPPAAIHYKRRFDETLAELHRAQAALEASRAEPEPVLSAPSAKPVECSVDEPAQSALAFLRDAGYGDVEGDALRALLSRGALTDTVLQCLGVTDPRTLQTRLTRYLLPCCDDPACRSISEGRGRIPVTVPGPRCAICSGRGNQRAVAEMCAACDDAGVRRLLVVGGTPTTHAELRRMTRDAPLKFTLIEGNSRFDLARARAQMLKTDLLVIWGATELDHATSNNYRDARPDGLPLVHVTRRGLAALAFDVRDHLRASHESGQ